MLRNYVEEYHQNIKTGLSLNKIKELLEQKVLQYNQQDFLKDDPIRIPRLYSKKTSAINWTRSASYSSLP